MLLLTAWTSLETAVQLVKEGASDYLAKPWDDAKLAARGAEPAADARRCSRRTRACARSASRAARTLAARYDLRGLVYASAADARRGLPRRARRARSDAPVLITGPNGAGKEKLAEIVQANSRRKDKPFVKVNAGALPDELLEAELFGAEAGAFTGADQAAHRAASRPPTAARCSSTRSATCRWPAR